MAPQSSTNASTALEHEIDTGGARQTGWFDFQTRLYNDSANDEPIWLVHQQQGSRLDIAVIPLAALARQHLVENQKDREELCEIVAALNGSTEPKHLSLHERPFRLGAHSAPDCLNKLEIAQELYVIGFPEAIAAGEGTAIWKRGSIASEPELPIKHRPCFLIDTATRPGLSGSPVVGKFINPSWNNNGRGVLTQIGGTELGFCGLYTSRLGQNVEGAQLGIVWTREAIHQVIENGVPGKPSSDFSGLIKEGLNDSIV
jgi:hypothetical protein